MIAIIQCTGTNLTSIAFALDRLNVAYEFTSDPDRIVEASHVILPGVGHARPAMNALLEHDLVEVIPKLKQPVLGICLGMQLMFDQTQEGETLGLGIFPGNIVSFEPKADFSVPHMGWNQLELMSFQHPLLAQVKPGSYVYFVHQYYAPANALYTVANCHYGLSFAAIVQLDNFFGMQFHPEKSSANGLILLKNFISL